MDSLGITFAFGKALGGGVSDFAELEKRYAEKCRNAALWLRETPEETEGHGWVKLPQKDISSILETARWLGGYDSIIHVGIGGSALGNLMLNQALLDAGAAEAKTPRFFLADNPDPAKTQAIWQAAKDGSVALVGVSKSGATAETTSQFLWFREKLREKNPNRDPNLDILLITDPEKGIFRAYASETGCRALDLPPSVGGRYSALSSAGLVSAAALGIDVNMLLDGAARMSRMLDEKNIFSENPAYIMAALHVLHENAARPMSVLMPYSSKLERFAEWYAQLWGESLGKDGKGSTPVRALGAIDQHSQLQLYTEGPDDKFYTILNVRDHGARVTIPHIREKSLEALSYMAGAEIGEMLRLEAQSTAAALAKKGRPVAWVELARIDARTIGAMVFFYEYMTALTGYLMGVNPFDQPGVEQGKRYTYGLMGRPGHEKDAEEAKNWFGALHAEKIDF